MIRYLKYLFLAFIAVCLVVVAVANRDIVTLRLIHDDLAAWTGGTVSVDLPLFLIVFGVFGCFSPFSLRSVVFACCCLHLLV